MKCTEQLSMHSLVLDNTLRMQCYMDSLRTLI